MLVPVPRDVPWQFAWLNQFMVIATEPPDWCEVRVVYWLLSIIVLLSVGTVAVCAEFIVTVTFVELVVSAPAPDESVTMTL